MEDWKREYPHMPKKARERTPRRPEDILLIMGPRTFEGGYSASQYMSSTMFKAVNCALGRKATAEEGVLTLEAGATNAETAARMAARIKRLSLAMMNYFCDAVSIKEETGNSFVRNCSRGEFVMVFVDNQPNAS
jgi:hypothetical protein